MLSHLQRAPSIGHSRVVRSEAMKSEDATQTGQEGQETRQEAQSVAAIIAEHPLLKDLAPHWHRVLADSAMQITFQPGETIFREGDPANRFYLILSGKVALEAYAGDGERVLIQTIEPGDALGWSWLFPPYYWQFDARALEPTKAIFFYATPLREECEADHDLGYELMKRMAGIMLKRLQATRRQLLESNGLRTYSA